MREHYSQTLVTRWKQHLAPRAAKAPTVISTFAGCGGSSLGYSMAGYRELLAVEWDKAAAATFEANFPKIPIYVGDIANLSVDEVLQQTKLKPGQLDVFDGSPPCQGFSLAGKRNFEDSRNQLFLEYVRLLDGLRPKTFVMENVGGMVKGKMRLVFVEILKALKAVGYDVSARLMNTMYFEVPQSRPRMIFIGIRNDLGLKASHPAAVTHGITFREAIEGVTPSIEKQQNLSPLMLKRWRETPRGKAHHERFGLMRLHWDRPVPTILRQAGSGGHFHPDQPRRLSITELKACCSFPKQFEFPTSWITAVCQLGNCVPPLFMYAIACHIRENILGSAND